MRYTGIKYHWPFLTRPSVAAFQAPRDKTGRIVDHLHGSWVGREAAEHVFLSCGETGDSMTGALPGRGRSML